MQGYVYIHMHMYIHVTTINEEGRYECEKEQIGLHGRVLERDDVNTLFLKM